MKINVYKFDRSECGMADPVIRRVKARGWWCENWREADIVIIPGDRREAMRFALDVFEAGKRIWHLGAEFWRPYSEDKHYDHKYREILSSIGKPLYLRNTTGESLAALGGQIVGPTMIDDLPEKKPHVPEMATLPYVLLCYSSVPFSVEKPPIAKRFRPSYAHFKKRWINPGDERIVEMTRFFAMYPGNDGDQTKLVGRLRRCGWSILPRMRRGEFLGWIANAEKIVGNSSLLTYEAPLWHEDKNIIHVGNRNKGRGIARWDVKKFGSPSDNVIALLEKECNV